MLLRKLHSPVMHHEQSNTSPEIIFSEGNADRQLNDRLQLNKGNYITSLAFSHIILLVSCIKLFNDLFLKRIISLPSLHRLCSHTDAIQALLETCSMWRSGSSARALLSPEPRPCRHLHHHLHPPALPSSLISAVREPLSCQHHTPHSTVSTAIPTCLSSREAGSACCPGPAAPQGLQPTPPSQHNL